jgi:hypothetical protein
MAKHIAKRSKGIPDNRIMHPTRDWLIGLVFVLCIFVVGSIYTGYRFVSEQSQDVSAYDVSVDTVEYKHTLIGNVSEQYDDIQIRFDELRGRRFIAPPDVVDDNDDVVEEDLIEEGAVDEEVVEDEPIEEESELEEETDDEEVAGPEIVS